MGSVKTLQREEATPLLGALHQSSSILWHYLRMYFILSLTASRRTRLLLPELGPFWLKFLLPFDFPPSPPSLTSRLWQPPLTPPTLGSSRCRDLRVPPLSLRSSPRLGWLGGAGPSSAASVGNPRVSDSSRVLARLTTAGSSLGSSVVLTAPALSKSRVTRP